MMSRCSRLSMIAACALAVLLLQVAVVSARTFTVNDGDSIQEALDQVEPGDTVEIGEGHYFEDIATKVDGTESEPITIRGKSGTDPEDIVLRGDGFWKVISIQHDYYIVRSFTVDGKALSDANDDNYEDAYRNKLIYVSSDRERTTRDGGYKSSIDGLEIRDMIVKNGGAECIRLRYFVTNAKIHDNTILDCGIHDFRFDDGGKTGEGVYIGTADEQWDDMPTDEPDHCNFNHVYDNYIKTKGNEGVQVKEGAEDTLIERNEIYMQLDDNSGGVDCRGVRCTIRYNYIQDTEGAGIRLGGNRRDGVQYGIDNDVYGNTLNNCEYCGIKVADVGQGVICENDITPPSGSGHYYYIRGDGADDYEDPSAECTSIPTSPFGDDDSEDVDSEDDDSEDDDSEDDDSEDDDSEDDDSGDDDSGDDDSGDDDSGDDDSVDIIFPDGYLGCYEDERGDRVLREAKWRTSVRMTIERCLDYCDRKGSDYAGLEDGHECWCGSDDEFDKNGRSDDCDMRCNGNDEQICGGTYALSIYSVNDR